jgi:hypothetical protein
VLEADQVLVAVGRRPRTQGWGLESLMLEMAGAAVKVDEQCRTSMRNVWAIGDLSGEPMLAHRAMAQGEMVADIIAGKRRRFEPAVIAAVCFTDPEVVAAGLSPADAEKAGLAVVTAQFPILCQRQGHDPAVHRRVRPGGGPQRHSPDRRLAGGGCGRLGTVGGVRAVDRDGRPTRGRRPYHPCSSDARGSGQEAA